jgi:tripartite-type tricarboxylate transporter receptor subunit TctC
LKNTTNIKHTIIRLVLDCGSGLRTISKFWGISLGALRSVHRCSDAIGSVARTLVMLVSFAAAFAPSTSFANDPFPIKPIKLIVGFAPGGSADTSVRVFQNKMSELLKQPVVIENRPGGGGNVALDALIKSPPDGYTIMFCTMGALSVNQFLTKQSYDPLAEIAPLSLGTVFTNVLVVPTSSDIKTLADYVRKGKNDKPLVSFGSAGIGTVGHLSGEMLKLLAGLSTQHIAYRSGGLATNDVLAGTVTSIFASPPESLVHIEAGKLRPLATTGLQRMEALPNVPTVAESGYPGFEAINWSAFVAPRNTPPHVLRQLNAAIVATLSDPDIQARMKKIGLETMPSTPEETANYIRREANKWGKLIKETGIKAN